VRPSAVGWQPIRQALSDNYDVIAFDLPGFGHSPALPVGVAPTAASLADAIEGELDRLGVAQFHVAGYSLGARVALELATRGQTLSVIAIAPDGLGTPLERIHQAAALLTGRTLATLLAPNANQLAATGAGRSLFFAMERSRPWQLPAADARQLLLNFAKAPGYVETVQATMFDVPTRLEHITCPVLLLQGTADPLVSMQSPRFLAFIRHAQLQWLPGLSHVPISDDPRLVASLMLKFLKTATEQREHGRRLPAQRDPGSASRSQRSPAPVQTHHGEIVSQVTGAVGDHLLDHQPRHLIGRQLPAAKYQLIQPAGAIRRSAFRSRL
jgi:pimeloyl-ACP methyl ester carboxylesterase